MQGGERPGELEPGAGGRGARARESHRERRGAEGGRGTARAWPSGGEQPEAREKGSRRRVMQAEPPETRAGRRTGAGALVDRAEQGGADAREWAIREVLGRGRRHQRQGAGVQPGTAESAPGDLHGEHFSRSQPGKKTMGNRKKKAQKERREAGQMSAVSGNERREKEEIRWREEKEKRKEK